LNDDGKGWSKRAMQTKSTASRQTSFLMPNLGEQLDPRQPLKQLADMLPRLEFAQAFGPYCSADVTEWIKTGQR